MRALDERVDRAYLGILAGARQERDREAADRAALRRDGYLAAITDAVEVITEFESRREILDALNALRVEVAV